MYHTYLRCRGGNAANRDRGPAGSEGESSPSPIHQQGRQTNQRTTGNPEDMMARFQKQIIKVNDLIRTFAPEQHKSDWQVDVAKGNGCFRICIPQLGDNSPIYAKDRSKLS